MVRFCHKLGNWRPSNLGNPESATVFRVRVIIYSVGKAKLKCAIVELQQVTSLKNVSILLISYCYRINVFVLNICGYGEQIFFFRKSPVS